MQAVTGGAPGEVGVAIMPAIVDRLRALHDGGDGERAWAGNVFPVLAALDDFTS